MGIYAPEVRDFVNITDKAYSKAEILDTEVCILNALQFRIQTVSPYFFLTRFLQVMKYGKTHTFLAQYILELTLVDYRMLKYPPTHLASAAALLGGGSEKMVSSLEDQTCFHPPSGSSLF